MKTPQEIKNEEDKVYIRLAHGFATKIKDGFLPHKKERTWFRKRIRLYFRCNSLSDTTTDKIISYSDAELNKNKIFISTISLEFKHFGWEAKYKYGGSADSFVVLTEIPGWSKPNNTNKPQAHLTYRG